MSEQRTSFAPASRLALDYSRAPLSTMVG
ncbi:hypothetical protein CCACVL1_17860 [Corchorus capsularis]|uniref:Uncharacterized protein n=1 Tax=Corchorus capsularis TaxID=210143 RepID=A0A1R3HPN0_COCAP|nr:hypothetical protein CCACVL1_17860 [Corchorus capsularis]